LAAHIDDLSAHLRYFIGNLFTPEMTATSLIRPTLNSSSVISCLTGGDTPSSDPTFLTTAGHPGLPIFLAPQVQSNRHSLLGR
jgi:hypothetical protein